MKKWILSIACVVAVCLLLTGLCYVELGSWNVIRTGLALSNVMSGGGVQQIADHPEKVWLSHDAQDFHEYLEGEGYVLVMQEQMGSRIPVEKDGVRDYVYWSANGLYHKWTWETASEPKWWPKPSSATKSYSGSWAMYFATMAFTSALSGYEKNTGSMLAFWMRTWIIRSSSLSLRVSSCFLMAPEA